MKTLVKIYFKATFALKYNFFVVDISQNIPTSDVIVVTVIQIGMT